MKHKTFWFLTIALLFVAFWLRLLLHDFHGLEGDDGVSIELTQVDTPQLVDGLRRMELDVHPPLHFLALKYWIAVAGDSLLVLRLSNIFSDLLMGALTIRIAGRLFNRRAGLLSGVLWLSAPLLLHAAYPIRMYMLLGVFITAGIFLTLEAPIHKNRIQLYYISAAIMGLCAAYTHILGVLAIGVMGAAMAVQVWFKGVRLKDMFIGWGVLIFSGILFLPFAIPIWQRFTAGDELGAQNAELLSSTLNIPAQLIATLLSHRILSVSAGWIALLLLIVASIALWRKYRGRVVPLLVIVWLSLLGMLILAAASDLYKPRYLAPFVPITLVMIAGAVMLIRLRWLRLGAIFGLVLLSGMGLLDNLSRDTRDDWQIAAQFLEVHASADDIILIIPAWGAKSFNYHYEGEAEVIALLSAVEPDTDLDALLQPLTENGGRIWHVRYQPLVSDPDDRVNNWLTQHFPTLTTVFPSGMQITGYELTPQVDDLPQNVHQLDAVFGDLVRLRGIDLPLTEGSARDNRLHPPSNRLHLTLYWETLQNGVAFVPRVRLTDSIGQVFGGDLIEANHLLTRYPVTEWQVSEIWRVYSQLNINPMTPPGVYNIEVMVLDPSTNEPLPTQGLDAGDFWVIAEQFVIQE